MKLLVSGMTLDFPLCRRSAICGGARSWADKKTSSRNCRRADVRCYRPPPHCCRRDSRLKASSNRRGEFSEFSPDKRLRLPPGGNKIPRVISPRPVLRNWRRAAVKFARKAVGILNLPRAICFTLALSSSAHGDGDVAGTSQANYFVRVWQTGDDGLPENNVTAVAQTRDGYLWLGTRAGLARFDGVHFTAFDASTTPALRSSHVSCLFEADDGTLWIGHADGEVATYKDGKFSARRAPERWRGGKISFICSDGAGDIWLLNQYGELARARDGLVIPWASSSTVPSLNMTRNRHGECWVQRDTDVSLLANGKLTSIFDEPSTNRY